MSWTVYYSDGSSVSSEDATPFNISYGRRADVQVIVQPSPGHNWVTLSGYDYYVWDKRGEEEKWWGVDIFGFHHYLLRPGAKCVLFGTMIDKKTFYKIFGRAMEEFGDKSGYEADERMP